MLFIHFKVWKFHKAIKIYQEACSKFFMNFARKLTRAEVQITKSEVCIAWIKGETQEKQRQKAQTQA